MSYELPEDYVYEWCDYVKSLWCERKLIRSVFAHELDAYFNKKFSDFVKTGTFPRKIGPKRYTNIIAHEWEERCRNWRTPDKPIPLPRRLETS